MATLDVQGRLKRARMIYLLGPLFLVVNRVVARASEVVVPASVLENENSIFYLVWPFVAFAFVAFCMVATWNLFRASGVSMPLSILNGVVAPILFPLVLLPQAIYIFRRSSRKLQELKAMESANLSSEAQT